MSWLTGLSQTQARLAQPRVIGHTDQVPTLLAPPPHPFPQNKTRPRLLGTPCTPVPVHLRRPSLVRSHVGGRATPTSGSQTRPLPSPGACTPPPSAPRTVPGPTWFPGNTEPVRQMRESQGPRTVGHRAPSGHCKCPHPEGTCLTPPWPGETPGLILCRWLHLVQAPGPKA